MSFNSDCSACSNNILSNYKITISWYNKSTLRASHEARLPNSWYRVIYVNKLKKFYSTCFNNIFRPTRKELSISTKNLLSKRVILSAGLILDIIYYYAFCYLLSLYTTILAYCTDIRVISLLHRAPMRDLTRGLFTASQKRYRLYYADPWALTRLKIDMSNYVILMIIRLSVTEKKLIYQPTLLTEKKSPDDHLSNICEIK